MAFPNVFLDWAYPMASSNARIAIPQARAETLTRPTSMPSMSW